MLLFNVYVCDGEVITLLLMIYVAWKQI